MSEQISGPFKVYVGLVDGGYLDQKQIQSTIQKGLDFCFPKEKIRGPLLIRPDFPGIEKNISHHAQTHFNVVDGFLSAATSAPFFADHFSLVYQKHPITANRKKFQNSHFKSLSKKHPSLLAIEELESSNLTEYLLSKGSALKVGQISDSQSRYWSSVVSSRKFVSAEHIVYLPKLRPSPLLGGFYGAIALGGTYNLCHKDFSKGAITQNSRRVVDMLEVANPEIIISDGIIVPWGAHDLAGEGMELGVILVSNNALAHDMIASKILGIDWFNIEHLRFAQERGWGPSEYRKIILGGAGEFGIELLQTKTKFWPSTLQDYPTLAKDKVSLELLSSDLFQKSGIQGLVLSLLHLLLYQKKLSKKPSSFLNASIIIGTSSSIPKNRFIYCLGDEAVKSLQKYVHHNIFKFNINGFTIAVCKIQQTLRFVVHFEDSNLEETVLYHALKSRLPFFIFKTAKPPIKFAQRSFAKTADIPQNKWWSQIKSKLQEFAFRVSSNS